MSGKNCNSVSKKAWASSTISTYNTHLKTYTNVCELYKFECVPAKVSTIEMYIAHLVDVQHFKFSTIKSYLNIISVLHKAHNLPDPVSTSWKIKHMLVGAKRELGTAQSCKAPMTPEILLQIFILLDLSCHNNRVFWAACLVGFFGFLRPNNLLVRGAFDPSIHIQCIDVLPFHWVFLLTVKQSKHYSFELTLLKCLSRGFVVTPYALVVS